jgi:hypothetical protein
MKQIQSARLDLHLREQLIDERAENIHTRNEHGYDSRSSDDED